MECNREVAAFSPEIRVLTPTIGLLLPSSFQTFARAGNRPSSAVWRHSWVCDDGKPMSSASAERPRANATGLVLGRRGGKKQHPPPLAPRRDERLQSWWVPVVVGARCECGEWVWVRGVGLGAGVGRPQKTRRKLYAPPHNDRARRVLGLQSAASAPFSSCAPSPWLLLIAQSDL